MNTLIIATSAAPHDAANASKARLRQRMDYFELSRQVPADYIDFGSVSAPHQLVGFVQAKSKIDFYYASQVQRLVRKRGYATVLSLSERVGIPLTYLLSSSVRHLVQLHHPLSPAKLRLIRLLRVPARWSAMLVYTRAELRALQQLLPEQAGRFLHITHPVDTHFFSPSPAAQPRVGQAISVGLSYRDYPTLLAALRLAPHVTCDIYAASTWIGAGSNGRPTADDTRVRFHDYLQSSQLRECYADSQFAVVPIARTTQLSAGVNAVLEAQAMGRPVVATRTPGMTEYVADGQTGILVDPGDSEAMAKAMEHLAANPDAARHMGARAREWVEARFSLDRWLTDLTTLLHG